jgi:hypothetical protein
MSVVKEYRGYCSRGDVTKHASLQGKRLSPFRRECEAQPLPSAYPRRRRPPRPGRFRGAKSVSEVTIRGAGAVVSWEPAQWAFLNGPIRLRSRGRSGEWRQT